MSAITISSKGQVTLPSGMRQHLGLKTGDKLVAEEINGNILLRPAKFKDFFKACEAAAKLYKGPTVPIEEMEEAWAEGALERDKRSRKR